MTANDGSLTRRDFLGRVGAGAAVAGAAALGWPRAAFSAAPAIPRPPNFIVLFTDDQGYQDLGCFGSPDIKTPCIDRMAAEGMKFTDFYVASPVCTPSRSALMTGCYPKRVGLHQGVLFPGAQKGLALEEITLAEMLKSRGYATICIGKWHLGDDPKFLPTRQGFDSYFGIPYSNDMSITRDGKRGPPLMRNEKIVEHPADQATLTERYTEEALTFIKANKDRPFFLYLPHTMPHLPLAVSDRFKGKSAGGMYGDVIETIDWGTGQILDTVRGLGLERDTIVIFTSDNGPWLSRKNDHNVGSALPLRNGKGTTYEGGMREPCVMWAPGRIPAGAVCKELAATMDLFPTFAAMAGGAVPPDRVIDGRDIGPLMRGAPGAKTPHDAYYYYSSGGRLEAVRSGNWKLRVTRPRAPRPKRGQPPPPPAPPAADTVELYDLAADIGEAASVADKHPDVVTRLRKMMEAFDAELEKTSRPVGAV
jgi:arylsulfatase A-like enzyme